MRSKKQPLPKQHAQSRTSRLLRTACALRLLLLLTLPSVGKAQFTYGTNNGTIMITGYNCAGGAAAIPDTINGLPVTAIGDDAFSDCASLTSVTIPGSVASIWETAFRDCTNLTAIIVDADNSTYGSVDGVLFDKNATTLLECPGGKTGNYTIPSSVTSLGGYAFFGCASLRNVAIPSNVTSIGVGGGGETFFGCTSLTAIIVDADNSTYGSVDGVLFDKNATTLLECPGGKTGNYTIPSNVTSVGDGAFVSCTSLTSVTIPNSVTNLGDGAFLYCTSLTNVTIPTNVTSIGDSTFMYCTSLASVTIPNSVISIGNYAFADCTSLTSVTIPSSYAIIGWRSFYYCTSLNGVYFQGNATSLGQVVFEGSPNATVYYLQGSTGWGPTFGGRPTALWRPQLQANDNGFGIRTNRFGFNITWASGRVVVVEACTDLGQPIWSPVGTNMLADGSSHFSDPMRTNYPTRFYRLRSP